MADSLGYSIFLDPKDTVRAWEMRAPLKATVNWDEMRHEQHEVAFTVAKIAKLDLLATIRKSLDSVIKSGGTYEEWQKALIPELKKAGWWGAVANKEVTGTDQPIIVNERRLRTIYDTNVRMSLSSGHWTRIQAQKDVLPYLRYLPSTSEHKRPLHMAWYGTLLPVDHPWWFTHFPPNGWFCKCHFEQVSERRMRKNGWSETPVDQIAGGVPTEWKPAGGGVFEVPAGIDPGFSFRPDTAHLRAVANKALSSIRDAVSSGLDKAADQTLREIIADRAFDRFLTVPDAVFPVAILSEEQAFAMVAKERVVVLPEMVYRKQRGELPDISIGHTDLVNDDYRLLPDIVNNALVIAQQGDERLVFFTDAAGRIWKAVVRQDADKELPAIVSFHKSEARKIKSETRNLKILLDRR